MQGDSTSGNAPALYSDQPMEACLLAMVAGSLTRDRWYFEIFHRCWGYQSRLPVNDGLGNQTLTDLIDQRHLWNCRLIVGRSFPRRTRLRWTAPLTTFRRTNWIHFNCRGPKHLPEVCHHVFRAACVKSELCILSSRRCHFFLWRETTALSTRR